MREMPFSELVELAADRTNGWSIGSFGAIGEFIRVTDEPACFLHGHDRIESSTSRGAIRFKPAKLMGVAWDSLSSDGSTWTHNLALCLPSSNASRGVVTSLGLDQKSVCLDDRTSALFDLGVARGLIRMCVRTKDAALKATLERAAGADFLSHAGLIDAVMRAQPHRVLLSPAGRIEVFQRIPKAHEASPVGPHTHLLAKLIKSGKLHSANDPIPVGWQSVLNLHPPRPWIGERGERSLDEDCDSRFRPLLEHYGVTGEADIERRIIAGVNEDIAPTAFAWPNARRDRAKARLVLRRLSAAGSERARAWRSVHDSACERGPR